MDNNMDVDITEFRKACMSLLRPQVERMQQRQGLSTGFPKKTEQVDLDVTMQRIETIEQGIKLGKTKLFYEELERQQPLNCPPDASQRAQTMELFEILLLTIIAFEKETLNVLGFLQLKAKGDVRNATLIGNDKRFTLLRFKEARALNGIRDSVGQEAAKMDPEILQKLERYLRGPGIQFEHVRRKLQSVLLDLWALPHTTPQGDVVPPLCYFSDPALAKFLEIRMNMNSITSHSIRKIWQRMGLLKAAKCRVRNVEKNGGKLLLT
jgi:hypothetical protein